MALVQTCTHTWWWCVSVYYARFAVFARTARVLPIPSQATRNLSFLEVFTGAVTLLFQVVVSLYWYGLVCISHSMETLQTCTRTWWWCVSMNGARFAVFARRARVLPSPSQATRNLSFLEVSAAPSRCCFKSLFMCTGTGWFEFPTEWNLCKRVRSRGDGA